MPKIPSLIRYLFHIQILLSLLLSSCGTNKDKEYTIGVSQCSDDSWRQTANREMLREASFHSDLHIHIKSVNDNSNQQIKDIENFITEGVDLLIVSPNEEETLTPIIKKAYNAGIPVVLLDRHIETNDYTAYVGADNRMLGYEAGLYVGGILKGKGNVVEMRGWETSSADTERHDGFTEAIAKFPNIQIVAQPAGDFLKDKAKQQMLNEIARHDKIDVVFAFNDNMALGVQEAYSKYSGRRPYIIGVDALPVKDGGIESISKNLIDASFIYPTGGDKVIDVAYKILKGEPYEKQNILYSTVVDKSNIRVLQLQNEQIDEHQAKIDNINKLLNKSIARYTNQRTLFYISISALILIFTLLVLVYIAYRGKNKANKQLKLQNDEISRQAQELEQQKQQLINLSQQLEEATQSKLAFFTNISHEFKTPLSLIIGPVETLLTDNSLKKGHHQLLTLVKKNSDKLLSLISQIIEFRSYENGKMKVNFVQDNFKDFIQSLTSPFYGYIMRKHIALLFETSDDDFTMWFDKDKVEKIYFNLLSNALKHVNHGGIIKVSLNKEMIDKKEFARLSVFNSGSYIPHDKTEAVFGRFYKLDTHQNSSGIGLAFTYALIDIHHGNITATSEEGKGTTFIITLPYHQDNVNESEDGSYQEGYTHSHLAMESIDNQQQIVDDFTPLESDKPILLVIEDNADMQDYMAQILKDDYSLIQASDGQEGIEKAVKYIPDVIISDVMMPRKDGYEVCSTIKENITTSHIPIILLTACSMEEQKALGFKYGADAYIPKPFNPELLKIRIAKLIENRQKIKETFSNNLITDNKKTTLAEVEQQFIDNFNSYVEAHISNPELNVEDIARHLGLSKSQLYRKIKSLTNYSPNELVRIVRLKYAKYLLSLKSKNITEVAYETGFSSPSYFTKCFKEFYNQSPTEYISRTDS